MPKFSSQKAITLAAVVPNKAKPVSNLEVKASDKKKKIGLTSAFMSMLGKSKK